MGWHNTAFRFLWTMDLVWMFVVFVCLLFLGVHYRFPDFWISVVGFGFQVFGFCFDDLLDCIRWFLVWVYRSTLIRIVGVLRLLVGCFGGVVCLDLRGLCMFCCVLSLV